MTEYVVAWLKDGKVVCKEIVEADSVDHAGEKALGPYEHEAIAEVKETREKD